MSATLREYSKYPPITFSVISGGDSVVNYLIPVGPATIVVLPNHRLDWRLNVTESIATIGLMMSPNTRLDLARSLYAVAPVAAIELDFTRHQ